MLSNALGILIKENELIKVSNIFSLCSSLFVLLKAETLKREQVEPIKLGVYLVLMTSIINVMYIMPDMIYLYQTIDGSFAVRYNMIWGLFSVITPLISWVYYLKCTYNVNKRSPHEVKKFSRLYFWGTLIANIGIISVLSQALTLFLIFGSVGVLMMAYAYSHEPKLLFVLPFKTLRLMVLDTRSGLPLFTHTWNQSTKLADETLFSGMLQGVSMIVKESLQRGDVQEIRVSDAIIIAYRNPNYPIACVLVATHPSQVLRDGLKLFAERFYETYNACFDNPNNVDQFNDAKSLIGTCFPHVIVFD